ncbi:UNVERIFIED_CONTAM: hypothetical protein FKN15_040068 [Acipenser sinensis]
MFSIFHLPPVTVVLHLLFVIFDTPMEVHLPCWFLLCCVVLFSLQVVSAVSEFA